MKSIYKCRGTPLRDFKSNTSIIHIVFAHGFTCFLCIAQTIVAKQLNLIVDLESQIFAQNAAVAKFEKSITKLQEETENLNDQCKINKEVSMR